MRRYGPALLALCQGQTVEPYRVRVTLNAQGVRRVRCTCPAERDGRGKHMAALLWAWHHRPHQFHTPQPLAPRLRRLSSQRLVELIGLLLEHAPQLHEVVEGYLAQQASGSSPDDTEAP